MTRPSFTRPVLMLAFSACALAACVLGWDSGPRADGPAEDGGADDAALEPDDGGGNVVDDAGVTFFAFDDETNWEDYPLDGRFAGAAFDGRYVYFVPQGHATLWRFDTTMAFADAEAWKRVELPTRDSDAGTSGFRGAAVANGKLYLAPAAAQSSLAVEYTTTDPFVPSSFRAFDLGSLAFVGGTTFKPRPYASTVVHEGFVYFVPATPDGLVARYDPQHAFDSATGWSSVRLPWPADAGGFSGSVATSAGLYLVPSLGRMLAVFDGEAFLDKHFATGSAVIGDFFGATTDGAQIYFAPGGRPVTVSYAVGSSLLASKEGPPSFALDGFAKCTSACFGGAVFDGRYVYFVPRNRARFVRYDTRTSQGFEDALSWAVGRPDAGNTSFLGGAFDGRYVYFVPDDAGRVVRFHAKEPAAMPAAYSGSFL